MICGVVEWFKICVLIEVLFDLNDGCKLIVCVIVVGFVLIDCMVLFVW